MRQLQGHDLQANLWFSCLETTLQLPYRGLRFVVSQARKKFDRKIIILCVSNLDNNRILINSGILISLVPDRHEDTRILASFTEKQFYLAGKKIGDCETFSSKLLHSSAILIDPDVIKVLKNFEGELRRESESINRESRLTFDDDHWLVFFVFIFFVAYIYYGTVKCRFVFDVWSGITQLGFLFKVFTSFKLIKFWLFHATGVKIKKSNQFVGFEITNKNYTWKWLLFKFSLIKLVKEILKRNFFAEISHKFYS